MANIDTAAIAAKGYAHPEKLVSTEWLAAHLGDPSLRILESDEDLLLYEMGHIPGAQKIDWHADLNDPVEPPRAGQQLQIESGFLLGEQFGDADPGHAPKGTLPLRG